MPIQTVRATERPTMTSSPAEPGFASPSPVSNETSPLLTRPASISSNPRSSASHLAKTAHHPKSPFYPYASILVGVISLVADFGGSLLDTPEVRLLEMAVCRDYYRVHDLGVIGTPPLSYVDEKLCKVKDIQANLAYLRASKFILMAIPGLNPAPNRMLFSILILWTATDPAISSRPFAHFLLRTTCG